MAARLFSSWAGLSLPGPMLKYQLTALKSQLCPELLWWIQQVLTHLNETVAAQDKLGWGNASVQQRDQGMGDRAAGSSAQRQVKDLREEVVNLYPQPPAL